MGILDRFRRKPDDAGPVPPGAAGAQLGSLRSAPDRQRYGPLAPDDLYLAVREAS